ncbi:MAG TPA: CarD family transcriptional regulator [Pyrinomonadaceae bacterium]|nr:CarD family transcriptional regulator [Pyrinomonadaceae bacterium]
MNIRIGQKVAYPNHGVCKVEAIQNKQNGAQIEEFYSLRVLSNNSSILVPKHKAESIGIRPVMKPTECEILLKFLAEDFESPPGDWKARSREFTAKFQTGDIFAVADILKKLSYLMQTKPLSFREQRMIEKAKFLVVSELAVVCSQPECAIEEKVDAALACARRQHSLSEIKAAAATIH